MILKNHFETAPLFFFEKKKVIPFRDNRGKQCPRIAIRLLALLVGDSPSPF